MSRHPGSVVDHEVDVVRGVGQAADASEEEQDSGKQLSTDRRIPPRELRNPAEQPLATALSSGAFERGNHSEGRQHRREEDRVGENGVDVLPPGRNSRINELVVETEWHRQQQEQPEGDSCQGVAEKLPSSLFREHRVPGHISWEQPEVDQWMAGEPEIRSGQLRVDAID